MDYEKKYKESMAKMSTFLAKHDGFTISKDGKMYKELSEIFPELKESDDERIRSLLISSVKNEAPIANERNKELAIAWLEKQSEQGNNEDEAILHRFSFYSYKDEPNILYLAGLYVNDEYRNKGIGTKILKIADEVAVSMKCSSILLKTEIGSNAERLYKNNGYSVFRREENQVWLEKQGEQKPTEWNEEDEKTIHLACEFIRHHSSLIDSIGGIDCSILIERLKSLKERVLPQSQWKPSDEQMDALAWALSLAKNCGEESAFELRTLHEQLKKL